MTEEARLEVVRTGGFGGLTLRSSVDLRELPPEQAQLLMNLFDDPEAGTAARQPSASRIPDSFQYDLVLSRGGSREEVRVTPAVLSPELQGLLTSLIRRSVGG